MGNTNKTEQQVKVLQSSSRAISIVRSLPKYFFAKYLNLANESTVAFHLDIIKWPALEPGVLIANKLKKTVICIDVPKTAKKRNEKNEKGNN